MQKPGITPADLLNMRSDELFTLAYTGQKLAAKDAANRINVRPGEDMVKRYRYGVVDFAIRLQTMMWERLDVRWDPFHPKFVVNDYMRHVNGLGLLAPMMEIARDVGFVQDPYKRSRFIDNVSWQWSQFEKRLDEKIPTKARHVRITMILLYVQGMLSQLEPGYHESVRGPVLACKRSFLADIGRSNGTKKMTAMMNDASEYVLRKYDEAAERRPELRNSF